MTRANSDEVELVALAFARAPRRGWQRADCPLCLERTGKRDERKCLGLNFATGGFICQKCGVTGWCGSLVDEIELHDLEDAVVPPAPSPKNPIEPCAHYVPLAVEPWASSMQTVWARDYLDSRGVSGEAIAGARIGACVFGRHRGRVIVPHLDCDPNALWLGWIGRDVTDQHELKYRYSYGMARTRLWNEAALRLDTDRPLLLVEGTFDALPYWPDATAFLGKPTKHHLATLATHRGRPIVWALDGDSWEEAKGLHWRTRFAGAPSYCTRLPAGEDPSSLKREFVLDLAARAMRDAQ